VRLAPSVTVEIASVVPPDVPPILIEKSSVMVVLTTCRMLQVVPPVPVMHSISSDTRL
jgi:hypothetical protein